MLKKTTKIFIFFLLLFTILIFSIFSLLSAGIKFDSFSFANIKISQFYIKLDKKLILDIESIALKSKKSSVNSSIEELKKEIDLLPKILDYFQSIRIENLIIDGNKLTIEINDKLLYLDSKYVNLSSKFKFYSKNSEFELYSLYLKDWGVLFEGKINFDYFNEKLNYYGKYHYKEVDGNLKLDIDKKRANVLLDTDFIKNIKFVKDFIKLPEVAEEWMYDNVTGDMKLENFYASYDMENKKLLFDSLNGKAIINNAKIRFHKKVKAVDAKQVKVDFKKNKLSFDLVKPKYYKKDISGSRVFIDNLTSKEKGYVDISIKSKAVLDKKILDILDAYKIKLPLIQTKGKTDAFVHLKIPYQIKKGIKVKGEFEAKNSSYIIGNFPFYTKNARVLLDGKEIKIVKSHFKHKNMINSLVDMKLDIPSLKAKAVANIKSFYIKDKKDEIINIKNLKSKIDFDFKNRVFVDVKALDTQVDVKNDINISINSISNIYPYSVLLQQNSVKQGNLKINYKNENEIKISGKISGLEFPIYKNDKQVDSFAIKGEISKKQTKIWTKDLNVTIKKSDIFIDLNDFEVRVTKSQKSQVNQGKLNINGKNIIFTLDNQSFNLRELYANITKNRVDFSAFVQDLKLPLKRANRDITSLDVIGTYQKDTLDLKTKKGDLSLQLYKNKNMIINLEGYDIYYDTKDKKEKSSFDSIRLIANNSNLVLNKKYKILSDKLEFDFKNKSSYLNLRYKKSELTFKEKNKNIDIFANNITPEYLNTIYKKDVISGGKLMFLADGTIDNLNGKVILDDVQINDLAIVNNLLLFIQTSPALLNPFLAIPPVVGSAANGFSLTSYRIVKGNIEFNYSKKNNLIDIKQLRTVGNGIDFDGSGKINLKDMTIDSKIKLIFFKDYTSLVGMIPVVNYVLLGDNKRVDTQVDIKGSLDNPKISTNLTKDAFSVPVNILKRIIKSPVELFNFITQQGK